MGFSFKVDGKKASTFGPLPEGEYEVFITGAKETTSTKGTPGVQMVLTVRDDVEQAGGKRKVWHTIWFTENTEGIVQGFMKALGVEDGVEFNSLKDIVDYVKGRPIRAKLGIQSDNKDFNEVKSFKETEIGGFYEEEALASNDSGPVDISDEDLPF